MTEKLNSETRRDAELILDDSLRSETEETFSFVKSLNSVQKLAFKSFLDGFRFCEGLKIHE